RMSAQRTPSNANRSSVHVEPRASEVADVAGAEVAAGVSRCAIELAEAGLETVAGAARPVHVVAARGPCRTVAASQFAVLGAVAIGPAEGRLVEAQRVAVRGRTVGRLRARRADGARPRSTERQRLAGGVLAVGQRVEVVVEVVVAGRL